MTGRSVRVVATVLAAVVALLLVGSAFRAEPAPQSCGVTHDPCVAEAATPTSAGPCISAPSCGGSGTQVGLLSPAVAPGAVVVLAALAPLGSVRRSREHPPYAGRLTDGGLFRPPRPSV